MSVYVDRARQWCKELIHKFAIEQLRLFNMLQNKAKHGKSKMSATPKEIRKECSSIEKLRNKMVGKLKGARFRLTNERLYLAKGAESNDVFQEGSSAFKAYHEGYRQQVNKWPINPVDVIFKRLSRRVKRQKLKIADFGCGDAVLAQKLVGADVKSFDIVAANDRVTACDMRNTNLPTNTVDVAIFCLSLMNSSVSECIKEANRVLKIGGVMKIADVESRFESVDDFIKAMGRFGFKLIFKDFSYNIFFFLDFKKICNVPVSKDLPSIVLKPCMYKKR